MQQTNNSTNLAEILKNVAPANLPAGLCEAVMLKIKLAQKRRFLFKIAQLAIGVIITISGTAWGILSAWELGIKSGLRDLLSVLFSDWSRLSAFWHEYVLSVVQAIPVWPLLIVAICLAALLFFVRKILQQTNLHAQVIGFKHNLTI